MKNFILSFFLLASSTVCMAQINLREGIVITLSGDTLHGSIDYRTDQMNAKQCYFIPDGKNEPVTYKPGEITGYRFLDNGRYYVSKTITLDENRYAINNEFRKKTDKIVKKTVFLEYIVHGQLSLYIWENINYGRKYFFLEDENGNVAYFESISHLESETQETKRHHRKNLENAIAMVHQSEKTKKKFWKEELSRLNVKKAIIEYNKEVCPNGICEVYEYKNKKTPKGEKAIHPTLLLGYSNYGVDCNLKENLKDFKYLPSLYSALGIEAYIPRLIPNVYLEAYACYHYNKSKVDVPSFHYKERKVEYKYATSDFTAKLGAGYQWKTQKIQPRLHGGASFSLIYQSMVLKNQDTDLEGGLIFYNGYYIGAGIAYPLRKGALLFDCQYNQTAYRQGINRINFSIGYQY